MTAFRPRVKFPGLSVSLLRSSAGPLLTGFSIWTTPMTDFAY